MTEQEYAAYYSRSHAEKDADYRLSYVEYAMVNALFKKPYTALIAGCGTLGYADQMNAKSITGIDSSWAMVAEARKIHQGNKKIAVFWHDMRRVIALKEYNLVEVGPLGCYFAWDDSLLRDYWGAVKVGGVLFIRACAVKVEDFFGQGSQLRNSISRLAHRSYVDMTVPQINQCINRFVEEHREAESLMRLAFKRKGWAGTNYYVFLRKLPSAPRHQEPAGQPHSQENNPYR